MLEDMLCMYVMDKPSKWEDYLHLVEFAYKNGHISDVTFWTIPLFVIKRDHFQSLKNNFQIRVFNNVEKILHMVDVNLQG